MAKKQSYTGSDITVLEGLDPVRKRPAMYIGGTDKVGYHHLAWEIVDNSIDEVINKHATKVVVTLHKDGKSLTVADNGRGIPVDKIKKYKKSALEVILTTLHAGGKFEAGKNYKHSGGLHGVGASVVNALSSSLIARVKRGGKIYEQQFSRGVAKGKMKSKAGGRGTGTAITFTPDPEIFGSKQSFDAKILINRLEAKSYLHRGVEINFEDEKTGKKVKFLHERGIEEYLEKIVKTRSSRMVPPEAKHYYIKKDGDTSIEICLTWTEAIDEHIQSYVNGVPTPNGGTHANGFKAAVNKAVRNFISTHKLVPKGITLTADDIREGLVAIVSVYVGEPQFQGQTKQRLNNTEVTAHVDNAVRPSLEQFLNENRQQAEAVVARIILAARARAASRAAAQAVSRKTAVSHRLNLPGKLADCSSTNPAISELFIVEGDSAGGSAKQGRDRKTQAILPLRGKVINAEQATLAKLLNNKEINDIISALGCGIGPKLDLSKLRYHKIFLLMDADADGHHIATLLLTFFFRHLRPLIDAGHVYLAQPPLYRVDVGKKTFWALDELERDNILKTEVKGNTKPNITRFKGLGEMNPDVLNKTTLDPKLRNALRIQVGRDEELATELLIGKLMGKDASARYDMITSNSATVSELDI